MEKKILSASELRKLQLTELEMLIEVDRICREEQIPYVIIAGTLLGAVRSGGFIPWDDDVDVALLRGDYERFVEACGRILDSARFCFQDHRTTPGYRWGYGKLRRRHSRFVRLNQEHMPYEQGIFIDVFPIDCVPDFYPMRALKNFECFAVRKFLYARVGKVAAPSAGMRFIYSMMDRVPEKLVLSYYESMIRRAGRRKTGWARILMFPTPNRTYGYRSAWYQGSAEYLFEGHSFPGVIDSHEYLSFKFGDYMQLPPQEMRKTHPVSSFRLPEQIQADDLTDLVRKQKPVVIGTGFVAQMFRKALRKHGLEERISAWLTSAEWQEQVACGGISSDAPVLIAVHESNLLDVLQTIDSTADGSACGGSERYWIYPCLTELLYGRPVACGKGIRVADICTAQQKNAEDPWWIEVRLAAVMDLDGKLPGGCDVYRKAMRLHCGEKTAERRLEQLRKLQASFVKDGFHHEDPVILTEQMDIIDGLHRVALCIYYGIETIPCDLYAASADNIRIYEETIGVKNRLPLAELEAAGFTPKEMEVLRKARKFMVPDTASFHKEAEKQNYSAG